VETEEALHPAAAAQRPMSSFETDEGCQHCFERCTYYLPTFCQVCSELLVGLTEQGFQCSGCSANVHFGWCMATACIKSNCTSSGVRLTGMLLEGLSRDFDRMNVKAESHYTKGQFTQALDMWQKCVRIAEQARNISKQGAASANVGSALCALGNVEEGIDWHKKHLAICLQACDLDGEGRARGNIGPSNIKILHVCYLIHYVVRQNQVAPSVSSSSTKRRLCNTACSWRYPWTRAIGMARAALVRTLASA
jgi:hypothetical protein